MSNSDEAPTRLLMAMTPDRALDVCDDQTRHRLESRFEVVWASDTLDAQELGRLLPGTQIVITSWGTPRLPADLLSEGGGPHVVAHAAGSVKRLLPRERVGNGLEVFSAAGRIAWSVGEYCLAACLTMLRSLPAYDASVRTQGWRPAGVRGQELRGRRVALIGASSTARAFRALLQPFGADVVVYDPYLRPDSAKALGVRAVSLEEAMASSIVSVHVPDVPATTGMISSAMLARMPDGGLLINSSRAAAIDMAGLEPHILSGRLQAALDVYETEPPELSASLRAASGVLLTPHIAGDSVQGHQALVGYVLDDVVDFLESGHRGPSWVDPAAWDTAA
ncbi:hydroxyacid dehydrogenase [Pseudactinotalea sp.]|uniref:hydroxyacid dehydrogenase n=1 Tax=Pseudactinotalea sp. TaxID=1926260 RepID=UPI003B3AFD74